jgi:transcriptional regulator with XRE-family HTH domain
MDLKQEFRDLLQASGWSQAEAARQLGMTPSALSQIVRENSLVRPSPVTLRLFGLLLRRQLAVGAGKAGRPEGRRRGEQWEKDLIRALRRIPPRTRKPILSVLYAMMDAAWNKGADGGRRRRPAGKGR